MRVDDQNFCAAYDGSSSVSLGMMEHAACIWAGAIGLKDLESIATKDLDLKSQCPSVMESLRKRTSIHFPWRNIELFSVSPTKDVAILDAVFGSVSRQGRCMQVVQQQSAMMARKTMSETELGQRLPRRGAPMSDVSGICRVLSEQSAILNNVS